MAPTCSLTSLSSVPSAALSKVHRDVSNELVVEDAAASEDRADARRSRYEIRAEAASLAARPFEELHNQRY